VVCWSVWGGLDSIGHGGDVRVATVLRVKVRCKFMARNS
jgi:hypothetical protein